MLDLIKPEFARSGVNSNNNKHRTYLNTKTFQEEQPVWFRVFGKKENWWSGRIVEILSRCLYKVKSDQGDFRVVRHVNQLRTRQPALHQPLAVGSNRPETDKIQYDAMLQELNNYKNHNDKGVYKETARYPKRDRRPTCRLGFDEEVLYCN